MNDNKFSYIILDQNKSHMNEDSDFSENEYKKKSFKIQKYEKFKPKPIINKEKDNKDEEKEKDNNNGNKDSIFELDLFKIIILIVLFLIFISLVIVVSYYFGKKCNSKRKSHANELDDNFEYFPNDESINK